jgi:hypothetical protein
MALVDNLLSGYLTHSNRTNVNTERAKLCIKAVIKYIETETGRAIERGTFTEIVAAHCSPYIYTPRKQPVKSVTYMRDQNGIEIEPILLKGDDITRLYIGPSGIFTLSYEAGYSDPDTGTTADIPSDLLELVYYLTEWVYARWDSGLIGTETRMELGTLKVMDDLDTMTKRRIERLRIY